MENEKGATTSGKPRIARRYYLLIAILVISLVVGAITQTYTYGNASTAAFVLGLSPLHLHKHSQLHLRPHLDFGALPSGSATMTFTSALVVGRGTTSPMTFTFVKAATTWDRLAIAIARIV